MQRGERAMSRHRVIAYEERNISGARNMAS